MNSHDIKKNCGFCGESIPVEARRCPYCGSILEVTVDEASSFFSQENAERKNTDEPKSIDTEQKTIEQSSEISSNAYEQKPPVLKSRIQGPANNDQDFVTDRRNGDFHREPLSNGLKVFLTVLFTIIPGLGQLAGIITAIVFMNSEGDTDRKSFGVALLVASLIMFVLACIGCFIIAIAGSTLNQLNY